MVYKVEKEKLGLSIKISPHRKHGNGAKGGGRQNTSGKKALVLREGAEAVLVTGSTSTELLKKVRKQFGIPSDMKINDRGETHL